MHISLIINGQQTEVMEQLHAQAARLREHGHDVFPHVTFEQGDARRMARSAASNGVPLVIAAGGDGTINEVANGLHDFLSQRPAEPGAAMPPRLAIIPLGTANDLATALQVPSEVPAAFDVALSGSSMEVDVGLLNDRCFLNVSTGGVGAEATGEAPASIKHVLGPLAYLITGVKKLVSLETSAARFLAGEVIYEGPFLLFAVGNFRRTGGGNHLTPRADLTDGLLDLCIIQEMSKAEFLALLPDLRTGQHLDHPAVIYRQVAEIRVEAEEEMSVNVDGEPLTGMHLSYGISAYRLRLMVP